MKQPHKGYVQTAFERRTGRTVEDWLAEHGPTMTLHAAAEEIGYAGTGALREYVTRHLPEGFKFYRRPAKFSTQQMVTAINRHAAGERWAAIAIDMGGDVNLLKESCRRYRKRQRNAAARIKTPGADAQVGVTPR